MVMSVMSQKFAESDFSSFSTAEPKGSPKQEGVDKQIVNKNKIKELINTFVQNTTVHGVRYIGQEHSKIVFRILWLLVFLICATLMMLQIIDRLIYYTTSPVSVDVRINHNNSLPFPSMTICNTNAFRTTATAEKGQYELLEDVYSGNLARLNTYTELHNTTLRQLYLENGHRKEDMIIQCKWSGRECNASWFTTTITDFGLCFTFNDRKNGDILISTESGSNSGLELLLNIEQYDYMPGPHMSAGVKILLHEPDELPFIDELGKALQTGAKTFIGAKMLKIHHLLKPVGNCGHGQLKYLNQFQYTPPACLADCRAELILKECGCLDFYFPPGKSRSCTVTDIPCVFKAKDAIRKNGSRKCNCPVLCHSTNFESEISFGSLSNLALQKLINDPDIMAIGSKYRKAREVSQRKWKHVVQSFENIVNNLQKNIEDYKRILNTELYSLLLKSMDTLKRVKEMTQKHWNKKRYYYQFQDYVLRKNVLVAADEYDDNFFKHVGDNPYGFTLYITRILSQMSNTSISQKECDSSDTMRIIRGFVESRLEVARMAVLKLKELFISYKKGISIFDLKFDSYDNETGKVILPKVLMKDAFIMNSQARHNGLVTKNMMKHIKVRLKYYLNLTQIICQNGGVNITDLKAMNDDFTEKCRIYQKRKINLFEDILYWPKLELTKRIEIFEEKWKMFESIYKEMEVNFQSYLVSLKTVNTTLDKINKTIMNAHGYIKNTNYTKYGLYEDFSAFEYSGNYGLYNFNTETNTRENVIVDHWKTMLPIVQDIWTMIINDIDMMEFYKYVNETAYLVDLGTLKDELESNFSRYMQQSDFSSVISRIHTEFFQALDQYDSHLIDFANSLRINESFLRDNFLMVEVFYSALHFEEIRQQLAYDIIALLCDIGGSMGLFVGASVISVFEILNLFFHIIMAKRLRKTSISVHSYKF